MVWHSVSDASNGSVPDSLTNITANSSRSTGTTSGKVQEEESDESSVDDMAETHPCASVQLLELASAYDYDGRKTPPCLTLERIFSWLLTSQRLESQHSVRQNTSIFLDEK